MCNPARPAHLFCRICRSATLSGCALPADMALVPRVVKVTGKASGSGSLTALASRVGEMLKKRDRPDGRAPPPSRRSPRPRPAPLPPRPADRRARRAGPETISVFEATTGGLVNAALQSVPGASRYCATPCPSLRGRSQGSACCCHCQTTAAPTSTAALGTSSTPRSWRRSSRREAPPTATPTTHRRRTTTPARSTTPPPSPRS